MPRSARRLLGAPLVLAALFILTSCGGSSEQSVVVSAARTQALTLTPGGFGNIVASVDRAIVYGRHARVLGINVRSGQRVAVGDLLATVSTVGATDEANRLNNLIQADSKLLQQLKVTVGDSNPQTLQVLGRISDERRQLAVAQSGPSDVRAPVAGTVGKIAVGAGASIDGTDILMHVVDSRSTVMIAPIALEYSKFLKAGLKAEVSVPNSSTPPAPATLTSVNETFNADGTGIDTTFTLQGAADRPVLGQRAYVRVSLLTPATVVVNSLAVSQTAQSPFVFVSNGNQVRMQKVQVGVSDGTWTQILAGLSPGDEVVVSAMQNLVDGSKIHISQRQTG